MNRACGLLIFLVLNFYFEHTLGRQPNFELPPCYFMYNGKSLYMDQYPNTPIPEHITSHPLSNELPVEIHLNESIPEQYRDVFGEVASEWNREAEFEVIRISDEVDHSTTRSHDDRNVIYWLNDDQYDVENITSKDASIKVAIGAFIEVGPKASFGYYIPIVDVDIVIYEEQNNVREFLHWIFTDFLKAADINSPDNTEVLDLQSLFIERLSNMNNDDFYEMMIQWMRDNNITFSPNASRETIQSWVITQVNERVKGIKPLESFEGFQALMIEEHSVDLTAFFDSSALLKSNMLHEFGHVLGLSHPNTSDSLMHDGFSVSPVPKFPRYVVIPQSIDKLALYGLLCSYEELEHLEEKVLP